MYCKLNLWRECKFEKESLKSLIFLANPRPYVTIAVYHNTTKSTKLSTTPRPPRIEWKNQFALTPAIVVQEQKPRLLQQWQANITPQSFYLPGPKPYLRQRRASKLDSCSTVDLVPRQLQREAMPHSVSVSRQLMGLSRALCPCRKIQIQKHHNKLFHGIYHLVETSDKALLSKAFGLPLRYLRYGQSSWPVLCFFLVLSVHTLALLASGIHPATSAGTRTVPPFRRVLMVSCKHMRDRDAGSCEGLANARLYWSIWILLLCIVLVRPELVDTKIEKVYVCDD